MRSYAALSDWMSRRAGWLYIAAMLIFAIVISQGWIGRFTVLRTVFDWPAIQGYLSQTSDGFLIGALVGIYLELVKPNTMSKLFSARLQTLDAFLAGGRDDDGVRYFLRRAYGEDAAVKDLADTVVSDKPTLHNCRLEFAFHDSPRAARLYVRRNRLSFDADFDVFTLGFARTPAVAERLIHDVPHMTEVIVVDHEPVFTTAVEDILAARPVLVDGIPLVFERGVRSLTLPARAAAVAADEYLVVRAEVPPARVPSGRRHFAIDYSLTADRDAGRHFWIADRPMYMQDIRISMIGLTGVQDLAFEVLSFLGSVEDIGRLDVAQSRFDIHVGHWLVRGQGVCMIWRQRATPAAVAGGG